MRFSHQKKSIENYTGNVVKSKKIGYLTVRSFFKPPLPDPDSNTDPDPKYCFSMFSSFLKF